MTDEDTVLCTKLWKYCISRVVTFDAGYSQVAHLFCLLAVVLYIYKVGAKNTLENVGAIVREIHGVLYPKGPEEDKELDALSNEECEQITDEARALVEYFASIEQDTGEAS